MLGRLGIWVERLDKCGTWEKVVEQACKSGISWIVIKAGDAYRNNQFRTEQAAKFIDYAHKSGMQVYSWHQSRPHMWTAEVHMIDTLLKEGVDGHIIVPSAAWQNQDAEASKFMKALRKKTSGFVAYSAPLNQSGSLPLETFGKSLDAFMPVLHGDLKASLDSLSKTTTRLSKANPDAIKPVYPVLSTRGPEELTKAMAALDSVPISLSSWEESAQEAVFVFPLLQRLNEKGLITLEIEPDEEESSDDETASEADEVVLENEEPNESVPEDNSNDE